MVKFAVWANFLHIFVYSGFFSKMRLINLRLCIFVSLKTGLALQLPTILLFSKYVGSYINEKKKSTVIPPNSRFLGLRKNRNREFGCLIKVPRVWRYRTVRGTASQRISRVWNPEFARYYCNCQINFYQFVTPLGRAHKKLVDRLNFHPSLFCR